MATLLLVDVRVDDYKNIVDAARDDVRIVEFDSAEDTYVSLLEKIRLSGLTTINIIGIVQHGSMIAESYSLLRKEPVNPLVNIKESDPELSGWASYIQFVQQLKQLYAVSVIDLISCQLYNNPDMVYVITKLEQNLGINFRASSNNTGNLKSGGDWLQESDGVDIRSVYFTDAIEQYKGLLFIITTAPPYFTTHPGTITANLGGSATFTVVFNFQFSPSVSWLINGTVMPTTTLVNTSTAVWTATYTLTNVDYTNNNTTVAARATYSGGTVSSNTGLLLVNLADPGITTSTPSIINKRAGETATFTVSASGTAPFTYQWRINNVDIPDATSNTYTTPIIPSNSGGLTVINPTNPFDGAVYTVLVTNGNGNSTESQPFVLYVEYPIRIVSQPQDLSIASGLNATFNVTTDGSGAITYRWFVNNVEALNIVGSTSSSYTISNVSVANSGSLVKVVANNSWSSVESDEVPLFVGNPSSATDISSSAVARVGSTITLSSTISGTSFSYHWQKNGVEIPGTFNTYFGTGAVSTTYTTPALTSADNGVVYSIYMSSHYGPATKEITLSVFPAITITTQPVAQTYVTNNSSATLSVSASGSGTLSYKWYRDNVEIPSSNSRTFMTGMLSAGNNQLSYTAYVYKVVVTDQYGSITSNEATVYVGYALATTDISETTYVSVGSSKTLTVDVSGSRQVLYTWRLNGVDISGANGILTDISATNITLSYTIPAQMTYVDIGDVYSLYLLNPYGSLTKQTTISIGYAPTIVTQPTSKTALVGDNAVVVIDASGSPTLTYSLVRTDNPSAPSASSTNNTLYIPATSTTQYTYYAIVANPYGSVQTNTWTVRGYTLPTITQQPQSLQVRDGSSAVFTVIASGSGILTYQWAKDNVNIAGATSSTYSISSASASSAGAYSVIVSSEYGSTTSNPALLDVTSPPVITVQPASRFTALNAIFSLSCTATGYALSYQWYKNGVALAGKTGPSLLFLLFKSTDVGQYKVVVSNALGSVESAVAVLALGTPPTITDVSASIFVVDGSSAVLSVLDVSGPGPYSYAWFRHDGSPIADASGSSYTLSAVYASTDNGTTRRVSVSNEFGSVSKTFYLNVGYPPVILTQPTTIVGRSGTQGSITIDASGSPVLKYSAVRSDNPNPSYPTTYPVITDYFNSLTTYVIVSNDYGSVQTNTWSFRAGQVPVITAQPQTLYVVDGSSATLSVSASGEVGYTTSYQWKKDGTDISGATSTSYSIPTVSTSNAGNYTVVVSNTFGSTSSSVATIHVGYPPVIITPLQSLIKLQAASATFSVDASGSTPLTYTWRKGTNASIPSATSASYQIPFLYTTDSGTYSVVVSNPYGSVSSTATLDVGYLPTFTSLSNGTLRVGVGFTVSFSAYSASNVKWQWNGVDISGANGYEYTTPALTLDNSGTILTAIAYNQFGTTSHVFSPIIVDSSLPANVAPLPNPVFLVDPTVSSGKIHISIADNFTTPSNVSAIEVYVVQYNPSLFQSSSGYNLLSTNNSFDISSTKLTVQLPLSNPYSVSGLIDGASYRVFMKVLHASPIGAPTYSLPVYPVVPGLDATEQAAAAAALQDFERNTAPSVSATVSGSTIHVSYAQQLYKMIRADLPDTTTIQSVEFILTLPNLQPVLTKSVSASSLTYSTSNGQTYFANMTTDISAGYSTTYALTVKTYYTDSIIYTTQPLTITTEMDISTHTAFLNTLVNHPFVAYRPDFSMTSENRIIYVAQRVGSAFTYQGVKSGFTTLMTSKIDSVDIDLLCFHALMLAIENNDLPFANFARSYVNGVLYAYSFMMDNSSDMQILGGTFTNKPAQNIRFPPTIRLTDIQCTITRIDPAAFNPNSYVYILLPNLITPSYEINEFGNIILDQNNFPNITSVVNNQSPHLFMISSALLPGAPTFVSTNNILYLPNHIRYIPSRYFFYTSITTVIFSNNHATPIESVYVGLEAFPSNCTIHMPVPLLENNAYTTISIPASSYVEHATLISYLPPFINVSTNLGRPMLRSTIIDLSSTILTQTDISQIEIPTEFGSYGTIRSALRTLRAGTLPNGCVVHIPGAIIYNTVDPRFIDYNDNYEFTYTNTTPTLTRYYDIYYSNFDTEATIFKQTCPHDLNEIWLPNSLRVIPGNESAVAGNHDFGKRIVHLPRAPVQITRFTVANTLYTEYYGIRYGAINSSSYTCEVKYIPSDISGDVVLLRVLSNEHFPNFTPYSMIDVLYTYPTSFTNPATDLFLRTLIFTSNNFRNGQKFWYGNAIWINNTITGYAQFDSTTANEIYFPRSMIQIYDNMFYSKAHGLTAVKRHTLELSADPNSHLKTIGASAFRRHRALSTFEFTALDVGEYAFNNCEKLTSIAFSNTTSVIGNYAFEGCMSLASININTTQPLSIGARAFGDCSGIEHITIVSPSLSIDPTAFIGCKSLRTLTLVNLDTNITDTFSSAFSSLTQLQSLSIKFKDGQTTVSLDSLAGLTSLQTVDISGNRPVSMPVNMFAGCTALTNISITAKLTSVGASFVNGCTALQHITMMGNNISCASYFNGLSSLQTIILDGFTSMPLTTDPTTVFMFKGCTALREITIGSSLTQSLSANDFTESTLLEKLVLKYSTSATSVPFFKNMANYSQLTRFELTGNVYIPSNIINLFSGCTNLKNIIITGSCEAPLSAPRVHFSSIETITINGKGNFSIADYAFKGLTSLKSVILGGSISSVGIGAFYDCAQLSQLDISQITSSDGSGTSIHDFAFALTGISNEVIIPSSVGYMGLGLFVGCTEIPKIIYNTPVISYIDHTVITTNMWKYLSFIGPTVIEISGDFIGISPSENSALTSYQVLNKSTQQYTTQAITAGDYKKYVDISKFNDRKIAFETILSNLRIIYNALSAVTNPSAAINDAKQRIAKSISFITEDARYACSLPHKQFITNRLSSEFLADAALVNKSTEATTVSNAYQTLINSNNTMYSGNTPTSATALETLEISENIRITLDGKLIDRVDGLSLIDISNGEIWYEVFSPHDGGAKVYLHDGTYVSVLIGSIRVNLTTTLGPDLANIMFDLYRNFLFIEPQTTNYEFNGNVTSISVLSNKNNITITINSPTTIIYTSAFEDCSQTIFDISAVNLKLYESSFLSCKNCTMRINALNEIIADKNVFIGTEYCTIDTNKQIINIPADPIIINYGNRNFNDISSIIIEATNITDFSDIMNVEFNLCNSEYASMFAPSIFAISFKKISTLQYYDIILQPSDWFWCYKLDPFLEKDWPLPDFSNNNHKYKYLTQDDGFINNFAPDTFTYKNRTFTRTAGSKDNGSVSINSYHSTLQKAKDDKEIQFRQNWLPIILMAVTAALGGVLAAAPAVASVAATSAFVGGTATAVLSAAYATTIVVLTVADLAISIFEIVNDVDLAYFDGQGLTPRSDIITDVSGSSRGIVAFFTKMFAGLKNGMRYIFTGARTNNITSVQNVGQQAAAASRNIKNVAIAKDVASSSANTSKITKQVIIKPKAVIKKLRLANQQELDALTLDEIKALKNISDSDFARINKMNPKLTKEKLKKYIDMRPVADKMKNIKLGPNGQPLKKLDNGTWVEQIKNPTTGLLEVPASADVFTINSSNRMILMPVKKPSMIFQSSKNINGSIVKINAEISSSITNELTNQATELQKVFSNKLISPNGSKRAIPVRVDNPVVKRLSLSAYVHPEGIKTKSYAASAIKQTSGRNLPNPVSSRSISSTVSEFINRITEFNAERSNVPNVIDGLGNSDLYMESLIKNTSSLLKTNTNSLENMAILDRIQNIIDNFPNNADVVFGTYNAVKQVYPEMLSSPFSLNEIVSYASLLHKPNIVALNSIGSNTVITDTFDNLCDYSITADMPPYISQVPLNFTHNDAPGYNIYYYMGAKSNKQPESYNLDIEGHANQAFQFASPLMRRSDYLWNGVYAGPTRDANNPVTGSDNGNPILSVNEVGLTGDQFYLGTRAANYTITTNEKSNTALAGATNLIVRLREITSVYPYAFAGCDFMNGFSNNTPFTILNLELPLTVTSIGERAFYRSEIKTAIIPPSCKTIGKEAFAYCNIVQAKFTDYDTYRNIASTKITTGPATVMKANDQDVVFENVPEIQITDSSGQQYIRNNVAYVCVGNPRKITYTNVDRVECYESRSGQTGYFVKIPRYLSDISSIVVRNDEASGYNITNRLSILHYNPVSIQYTNAADTGKESIVPSGENPITSYGGGSGILLRNDSWIFNEYLTNAKVLLKETSTITFEELPITFVSVSARSMSRTLLDISGTVIGENAFAGNTTLVDVTLPSDVTVIGPGAFADTINLETIELPPSLTTIGDGAFSGAISLTSVVIPPSVQTIGPSAFQDCSGLTELVIPSTVSIDPTALTGATSLQSVIFPDGISSTFNPQVLATLPPTTTVIVPPEYTAQAVVILGSTGSAVQLQSTTGTTVSVPCFPMGTRILTTNGFKEVEKLDSTVDKIVTADGRVVPYKRYYTMVNKATHINAPYVIPAHTFGYNSPALPVSLSPTHAFQIRKGVWHIPKTAAVLYPEIKQIDIGRAVLYFHIELPDYFRDNIVVEGGLIAESFGGTRIADRDTIYTFNAQLQGFTRRASSTTEIIKRR